MIVTILKKDFSDAVNLVSRFAEKRAGVAQALSGVALLAGGDGIKLRATNLETGIDISVPGTIEKQGVALIPGGILKEVAGSLSGTQPLTIEHVGDTITISSGSSRSVMKTLSYDDFPGISLPEDKKTSFTIPGVALKELFHSVAPYASLSTIRPELASVLLKSEGGSITAVATDSFRLAEKSILLKKSTPSFSFLIPAKNALDILQTIPDTDIDIDCNEHQCACSWKGGVMVTRLVNATYPDYTQIIPKTFTSTATVTKKDFEGALKQSAVFSDTFQKIKISYEAGKKQIVLTAKNNDIGETVERVNATITGDSIELAFNHRYLGAPLGSISTNTIELKSAGIGRPLIVQGVGDTTYKYLVMPMNQ